MSTEVAGSKPADALHSLLLLIPFLVVVWLGHCESPPKESCGFGESMYLFLAYDEHVHTTSPSFLYAIPCELISEDSTSPSLMT